MICEYEFVSVEEEDLIRVARVPAEPSPVDSWADLRMLADTPGLRFAFNQSPGASLGHALRANESVRLGDVAPGAPREGQALQFCAEQGDPRWARIYMWQVAFKQLGGESRVGTQFYDLQPCAPS